MDNTMLVIFRHLKAVEDFLDDNILKIYDYTEICVEIHGDHDVVRLKLAS